MSSLNLNNVQSVTDAIQRNMEEIGLAKRDVWPHTSMVPVESRERYLETLQVQQTYLEHRLNTLVKMKENQLRMPVINHRLVVAAFRFACEADKDWFAIVIDKDLGDYATATWREGEQQWNNGHYGLTYQEAIADAMYRAGLGPLPSDND